MDRPRTAQWLIIIHRNPERLPYGPSSWGLVKGDGAMKLLDVAVKNESEARDFMTQHGVWQE